MGNVDSSSYSHRLDLIYNSLRFDYAVGVFRINASKDGIDSTLKIACAKFQKLANDRMVPLVLAVSTPVSAL